MLSLKVTLLAVPALVVLSACGFNKTPAERVDDTLADLNATDAQKATIKKATDAFFADAKEKRAVRTQARETVLAELAKDAPDVKVLEGAAAQATSSLAATGHSLIDTGAVVHDALTPEQRAQLTGRMKPGKPARAAFFIAGRLGYGPPADAAELKERAAKHIEKGFDKIDATEAQRKQLRPLALALADEAAPLLDDQEALANALLAQWKSDKVDTASLHALLDADAAKIDALARAAADDAVTAHAVLTPAQRKQILDGARAHESRWHDDADDAKPAPSAALKAPSTKLMSAPVQAR